MDNTLNLKIGQFVKIKDLDYENFDFRVQEIRRWERTVDLQQFAFYDYVLHDAPLGKEALTVRLRVNGTPVQMSKFDSGQRSYAAVQYPDSPLAYLILRLTEDMEYNQDFDHVLNAPEGILVVNDNGESAEYRRIGLKAGQPWNAKVERMSREVHDTLNIYYWDFWREAELEGGVKTTEFLFAEINKGTGWIQVWQGYELSPTEITVL